jgi:aryl-alcohol dehydrogenase-like predicted oxidoreductase
VVPTLATVVAEAEFSMPLPASSRAQFAADLTICRILNGMWQVSGAHGAVDPVRAVDAMSAYHEAGFTTWDLADHYGPAEDFIGDFRRRFAARHGCNKSPANTG